MLCKAMHALGRGGGGVERAPGAGNLFEQFNQFNQARTESKTGSHGHRETCTN